MSCGCTENVCLQIIPVLNPQEITVILEADETGTWIMSFEFNGAWFAQELEVEEGENIVLPLIFNENYIHTIKFYKTNGSLFNDTCYALDTSKMTFIPVSMDAPIVKTVNQETYTFKDSPDEDDPLQKPSGVATLQDDLFKTALIQKIMYINDTPIEWKKHGITLNKVTGTFDFSTYLGGGTFAEDMYITIQYKPQ